MNELKEVKTYIDDCPTGKADCLVSMASPKSDYTYFNQDMLTNCRKEMWFIEWERDLADHHEKMTVQGGKLKSQKVNHGGIRWFTDCERLTQQSLRNNGLAAESLSKKTWHEEWLLIRWMILVSPTNAVQRNNMFTFWDKLMKTINSPKEIMKNANCTFERNTLPCE